MFHDAWFIAINDLKFMLRRRETLLWTFLIPPFVFFFVGTITAESGFTGSDDVFVAAKIEQQPGFLAEELFDRLQEQGVGVVRFDSAGRLLDANGEPLPENTFGEFADYALRLTLPESFTESVLAGEQVQVVLENDRDDLSGDRESFRFARAIYTVLADVVAASGIASDNNSNLADLTAADIASLRAAARTLTLEVSAAGRRIPQGFEQSVPGVTVMFTLLVLLTSGATALVIERRAGILRRLASTPMSRGAVVLGKWGGKFGLAVLQVGFGLSIGALALGVDFGPSLPMLLATLAAYTAMIAALGVLAGNFAKTEGQAIGMGVLSANLLAALGGCFWPIEVTPDYMQRFAMFLPTGWMMDAMHKLMIFGRDWHSALPHLLGMLIGAWVLGAICARRFRFE